LAAKALTVAVPSGPVIIVSSTLARVANQANCARTDLRGWRALNDGGEERIGGGTMDTVQGIRREGGGSTTLPDMTFPFH
jgi:hypothetical protein